MSIIKLYGLPRSGGTLIYNIVKELHPDKNIDPQTHSYFSDGDLIVVTFRDFRDSIISAWRVGKGFDSKSNIKLASYEGLFKYIIGTKDNISSHLNKFKLEKSSRKILFLKYEDWINDYNFLFNSFENFFNLEINKKKRDYILNKFSIENVKKMQSEYSSFKFYDKNTHFHGHHVYNGKPGTWREIIKNKDQKILTYSIRKELNQWEYRDFDNLTSFENYILAMRYFLNLFIYNIVTKNINQIIKIIKK